MPDSVAMRVANQDKLAKWAGNWIRTSSNTKQLMNDLAAFYLAQIFKEFRSEGRRDGMKAWRGFSPKTLTTAIGTPRIRYGTDNNKNKKKSREELNAFKRENNIGFKEGPMKGYKNARRYSSADMMLQASGGFRGSFHTILVTKTKALVGSQLTIAPKIIRKQRSKFHRPVVRISSKDRSFFARALVMRAMPQGSTT